MEVHHSFLPKLGDLKDIFVERERDHQRLEQPLYPRKSLICQGLLTRNGTIG